MSTTSDHSHPVPRWTYHNMMIIRTRQLSPNIVHRPKRLTLIIEYEYGEQLQHWQRFCQQHSLSYLGYRTILPSFTAPGLCCSAGTALISISSRADQTVEILDRTSTADESTPIVPSAHCAVPTIILARPLVDNFKLLRTLECR